MSSKDELRGALDAVERLLNRGGDGDEVLRLVVASLHERFPYAAIRLARGAGAAAGDAVPALAVPIEFRGEALGTLAVATDDHAFVERVATLISAYCAG